MPRLCRCGAIVEGRCEKCSPPAGHTKTTKQRGYGSDWRRLSERYREEFPLCQVCMMEGKAEPVRHTHHIEKVNDAPELRLQRSNLLSVCEACHERVEQDKGLARKAKAEQDAWGDQ